MLFSCGLHNILLNPIVQSTVLNSPSKDKRSNYSVLRELCESKNADDSDSIWMFLIQG